MVDSREYDVEKLEEVALALLGLTAFGDGPGVRAWKGLDWDLMHRLHERGWIHDPKGKAKSIVFTEEGAELAPELLRKHFGRA